MSELTASTECPVCGADIPLKSVNEHIDRCLKIRESDTVESQGVCLAASACFTAERKRQSLLSFGSPPSSRGSYVNPPQKRRKAGNENSKASKYVIIIVGVWLISRGQPLFILGWHMAPRAGHVRLGYRGVSWDRLIRP